VAWIDAAKGIGIVLVVWGHVHLGLRSAGIVSPEAWLQWVTDAIYTFHMPLFFFLAGLFARRSLARGEAHFWRSKVALILYAYVLWSWLQGLAQMTFAGASNSAPTFRDLASILWLPMAQFWFLYALAWSRSAFAAMRGLDDLAILAVAALGLVLKLLVDLPVVGIVLWSFFFFALGLALSEPTLRGLPSRWGWPLLALAAAIVAAATFWQWGEAARMAASVAGIFASIFIAQRIAWRSRTLRVLGRLSMAIFVMHVVAAAAARFVLSRPLGIDDVWAHLLLGTAAGLALPAAAAIALERAGLASWLALGEDFPMRRPTLGAGVSA
jgi:fucose 4-O-acetylase-like acetyltransferase